MSRLTVVVWITAAACSYPTTASAAGEPSRGAQAFQQCTVCHSTEPGRHLTGPSLSHVLGKKAGTATGFNRYSDALKHSGVLWNDTSLDKWLMNPQGFIPGNNMAFSGIRDAKTRSDVIAYLKAVSEGKASAVQGRGGMMGGHMGGMMSGGMMRGSAPADLKQTDTSSQVVSLHHCQDTYIVKTVDGQTRKIWEYNVRLKTDSSKQGPSHGKPVIVGSGMQGDRFSIVFASPAELSPFIKQTCD